MGVGDGARVRAAAQGAARGSYGKLVAFLSARTRDVAGAEDALADAFEAALRDWPAQGVPASPEAWLLAVARRELIDASRRRRSGEQVAATLQLIADVSTDPGAPAGLPADRLALMFACTHPAIEPAVRAPLMLQTLLGFDAATIASAFLVSPATMGQRLVRAKAKIRQAGIPLTVPEHSELAGRLDAVLAATYAAFAEGWSDPAGGRCAPPRPGGRGRLARAPAGLAAARRARSAGVAGVGPVRAGAAQRPARCRGRLRAVGVAGHGAVGPPIARRGRGPAAPRQHAGALRPLPAGGGRAVGTRRAAPRRACRLARDRRPVRRAAGDDVVACRRDQPGGGAGLQACLQSLRDRSRAAAWRGRLRSAGERQRAAWS